MWQLWTSNDWEKMGWARVGWERLQSFFFEIQMNCSFREKIGKRTQWISRSVFVKMGIFWFCQSIFMFPLYCLGRLKPQQMPTVITLVPGMTISQLLALQLPPHVLIHKCAMSNFNFSLYFSMIHNCKIFLYCISAIVKSIELYLELLILTSLVRQSETTIGWQFLSE